MKKVYSAQDPLIVGNLRNLLMNEGIQCDLKTPFLAAASGDIPFTECWSQLWVTNDEDAEKASELINGTLDAGGKPGASWKCSKCGEEIESQFEACWHCGSVRPNGAV